MHRGCCSHGSHCMVLRIHHEQDWPGLPDGLRNLHRAPSVVDGHRDAACVHDGQQGLYEVIGAEADQHHAASDMRAECAAQSSAQACDALGELPGRSMSALAGKDDAIIVFAMSGTERSQRRRDVAFASYHASV